MPNLSDQCACGHASPYQQCCQPLHLGQSHAVSAEQLMRSRFSAFACKQWQYLYDTGPRQEDSFNGPKTIAQWSADKTWLSLEVRKCKRGQATDQNGEVEFVAYYLDGNGLQQHHEHSLFARDDQGHWQFLEGRDLPEISLARNTPCPCGSKRKYKQCCLININNSN